jgi:hypothetical protein
MRPGHDPETRGLTRSALEEVRAIEEGRLKLEDAKYLPPYTRIENGRVVSSDGTASGIFLLLVTHIGTIAFVVLAVSLIGSAARWLFEFKVAGYPVFLAFGVGVCCLSLGIPLFVLRDLLKMPMVSYLQILIAVAGGNDCLLPRVRSVG